MACASQPDATPVPATPVPSVAPTCHICADNCFNSHSRASADSYANGHSCADADAYSYAYLYASSNADF